jgi:hypothetical protein
MESSPSSALRALPLDRIVLALLVWVGAVWFAAPGLTWLDSSELTAAGVTLGVPHAPGHPLYVMLAHLASLIPFGTTAFRVALLSGICAAAAAWFTADLVEELTLEEDSPATRRLAAFTVALLLSISGAVWQQAVRAEVYTLHLALILWATRDALRWRRDTSKGRNARLARVAFTLGLAAANHHLLTFLHLPALLFLLMATPVTPGDDRGSRIFRAVSWALPAALLYAVLPLRALTDPLMNYGDPRTMGRLWDLVTASVFQASITESSVSFAENLYVALRMLSDTIGAPVLFLALIGCWRLARRSPVLAATLCIAVLGNLASKVSMVIDPTNPDALGYFQTSLALLAALAGVAIVWGLTHASQVIRVTGVAIIGIAVLWTGTATLLEFGRIDHRAENTPMITDMALLKEAPPGSLWLTANTFLHFNRLSHQAVDGYRPDVLTAHQGLGQHVEGGAPLRESLMRRDESLEPLLEAASHTEGFPTEAVLDLARERPVMVEPTVSLPLPMESLQYSGGYMRVGERGARAEERLDMQRLNEAQIRVATGKALSTRREARTVHAILWLQLAVVRIQRGEHASAVSAVEHVMKIAPTSWGYANRLQPFIDDLATTGPIRERNLERIRRTDFTVLFD